MSPLLLSRTGGIPPFLEKKTVAGQFHLAGSRLIIQIPSESRIGDRSVRTSLHRLRPVYASSPFPRPLRLACTAGKMSGARGFLDML